MESKLTHRAIHIITNCGGNVDLAKKVASNNAYISSQQGASEDFERDAEILQHIEIITSKKGFVA